MEQDMVRYERAAQQNLDHPVGECISESQRNANEGPYSVDLLPLHQLSFFSCLQAGLVNIEFPPWQRWGHFLTRSIVSQLNKDLPMRVRPKFEDVFASARCTRVKKQKDGDQTISRRNGIAETKCLHRAFVIECRAF